MGDVLPAKRTVVNRLKRRFEVYRNHHNASLPRYEQAANGLYEAQRQETLLLKQRFLESKTKKSKSHKSDHHRSVCKESAAEGLKAQPHPKSVKRPAEESPITSTPDISIKDPEKTNKTTLSEKPPLIPSEKAPDQQKQTAIPNFSVQIAQQFNSTPPVQRPQNVATSVPALAEPSSNKKAKTEPRLSESQGDSQPFPGTIPIDIECKQEKDSVPDLCQGNSQDSSAGGTGGDRLSDTFPSLGFAEDSGDDVLHPDLLKDLIEDVFTNSADIMKDFNFEDSVGSIKDQEDAAEDIIDLVKGSSPSGLRFQTEGLTFANSQLHQQQNGLYENVPTSSASSISIIATTSTPTTTVSSFYSQSQRLPSYGGNGPGMPLSNSLAMDFKLTEPSPAALTLKQMAEQHQQMAEQHQQMAEQHQNMQQKQQQQQQQIVNSPLSNRPSFTQDVFSNHLNPLRGNYHNGNSNASSGIAQANSDQTPKTSNTANMFNGFNPMDSYPGVKPISENLNCNVNSRSLFKQEESATSSELTLMSEDSRSKQRQPKPPAYRATRPLTHYTDAMVHHLQPQGHHHHTVHSMGTSQFLVNPEPRFQMSQPQQMHGTHNAQQIQPANPDLKQLPNMIQPNHNPYGGYTTAPQGSDPGMLQHVPMAQQLHYSSPQQHFHSSNSRPPPEYKAHHPSMADNSEMHAFKNIGSSYMRTAHRPPNVTITPEGLPRTDWRHSAMNTQQLAGRVPTFQENYLVRNTQQQQQQFYPPQYRMSGSHLVSGGLPNMAALGDHMLMQQRNRMALQLRPRSESQVSATVLGPMYAHHGEIDRQQDGSQINLDFLDNIESSASDLLNFDQVLQANATHFSLLDDIEILGK